MYKRVTIKQIAEICGVSRGTVDRVLNGRPGVSTEAADKIRETINKLDYKPNIIGKALVGLKNPIRIGVIVSPAYNPFVLDLKKGIARAARELSDFGVSVDVRSMTTLKPEEQVAILEGMLRNGIDAISIQPIESPLVEDSLKIAIDSGVPVITFNSDLPNVQRLCFVGQDHVAGGRVAGNLMGKIVGSGKVAIITSSPHILCHVQRISGFISKLTDCYPLIQPLGIMENEDRDDLAYEQVRILLKEHPDLRGIYLTGGGTAGLGKGLHETGMAGSVHVVTHDIVTETVQLIKDGIIDFTIGQDPVAQGYLPIKLLHLFLSENKLPIDKFILTNIDIRTEDNLSTDNLPHNPF